jgi:hypothetical protein
MSSSTPVSNAEVTIRVQIQPGAKRCYWNGRRTDPSQSGTLILLIKVAPSGRVDSASAESNTGLSPQVVGCALTVARRAKFDPPGGNGSTVSVSFNFSE